MYWLLYGFFIIFKNYGEDNEEMVYENLEDNIKNCYITLKNKCVNYINKNQGDKSLRSILREFKSILLFFNFESESIIQDIMEDNFMKLHSVIESNLSQGNIFHSSQIDPEMNSKEKNLSKIPFQEQSDENLYNRKSPFLDKRENQGSSDDRIAFNFYENPLTKFSIFNPNCYLVLIQLYYFNKCKLDSLYKLYKSSVEEISSKITERDDPQEASLRFLNDKFEKNPKQNSDGIKIEKINSQKTNCTESEKVPIFKLSKNFNKNKKFLTQKRERSESIMSSQDKLESVVSEVTLNNSDNNYSRNNKKDLIKDDCQSWVFEDSVKKQNLKIELDYYKPQFNKDLESCKQIPQHVFMRSHFPKTYDLENFYIHIKLRREKLMKSLKNLFSAEIKNKEQKNSCSQKDNYFPKKLWQPNNLTDDESK